MNIKDLIIKTRSYRSFDRSVQISREALEEWVKYAGLTASTMNKQALKFKICTTDLECKKCLSLIRLAGKLTDRVMPPKGHEPTSYIVMCIDTDIAPNYNLFFKDIGIAAQTIMLMAAEAGFGGCMVGSGIAEKIRDELSIPSNLLPSLVLALGKPDERVELCEIPENGCTDYFRNSENTHFVPKRKAKDIII